MRGWRKMTWAIVIWTVLMAAWIIDGLSAVGEGCGGLTGSDLTTCQAGTTIAGGLAVSVLFFLWFIGFVVLSIIWFTSRAKSNVTIHGPQGQQVVVSEKEARQRVEQQGWTYEAGAPPHSS